MITRILDWLFAGRDSGDTVEWSRNSWQDLIARGMPPVPKHYPPAPQRSRQCEQCGCVVMGPGPDQCHDSFACALRIEERKKKMFRVA